MTTLSEIRELAQSATKDNHVGKFARAIQGLCDYLDESKNAIPTGTPRTGEQKTAGEVAAEKHVTINYGQLAIHAMDWHSYFGIPFDKMGNDNQVTLAGLRKIIAAIIDAEIAKEREACAAVADFHSRGWDIPRNKISEGIRSRK